MHDQGAGSTGGRRGADPLPAPASLRPLKPGPRRQVGQVLVCGVASLASPVALNDLADAEIDRVSLEASRLWAGRLLSGPQAPTWPGEIYLPPEVGRRLQQAREQGIDINVSRVCQEALERILDSIDTGRG